VIENIKQKLMKLIDRIDSRVMIACSLIFVVGIIVYAGFMPRRDKPINPAAFRPLLNLIAEGESNDNYNAYFSNPNNQEVDFTSMTVAEVMTWQKEFVSQGNPSSAVGRYQIINKTLSGLVNQLEVDTNEKFDKKMQDRLAIALLERRGAKDYVNDRISREEFAANLAKEWAALPKVLGDKPHESYYASDGLNQSRVAVSEVLKAINQAQS
jgi:muramidase (phage lysozyme)